MHICITLWVMFLFRLMSEADPIGKMFSFNLRRSLQLRKVEWAVLFCRSQLFMCCTSQTEFICSSAGRTAAVQRPDRSPVDGPVPSTPVRTVHYQFAPICDLEFGAYQKKIHHFCFLLLVCVLLLVRFGLRLYDGQQRNSDFVVPRYRVSTSIKRFVSCNLLWLR